MLTRRGRVIFALGFGVYLAAWGFGSKPLYPVACELLPGRRRGLGLGGPLGPPVPRETWMGRSRARRGRQRAVVAELDPTGSVLPASVTLSERVGRLGEQRHVLRRNGRQLSVRYVLENVPRGRYAFENVRAELTDPFGLEQAIVQFCLPAPGASLPSIKFSCASGPCCKNREPTLRWPASLLQSMQIFELPACASPIRASPTAACTGVWLPAGSTDGQGARGLTA